MAEDPQTQGQLVVSFANHANETNGLWVAYGVADRGETTNDWDTVAFVQTVKPETESLTYPLPTGWGSSVRAIRFFLSEVPYDVDYTLTYLQSDQGQRIVLNKFKFMGSYRLVTKMRQTQCDSTASPAFFSCRDGGNVAPVFGLFSLKGSPRAWRFDYNETTGSSQTTVPIATDTDYLIDASWKGLVVNGTSVPSLIAAQTYFTTETGGKFEFFCGSTGSSSSKRGNYQHQVRLYWAKIYDYLDANGNEKSVQALLADLVPAVKNGVPGVYDAVNKRFYANDTGTDFVEQADTHVENVPPHFTSVLYRVSAAPTVFLPDEPTVDGGSYTNVEGGIMGGTSVLKLTGANDWGGKFSVTKGTLVAQFGQGLGANDRLVLMDDGSYGGWNGMATNAIGIGPGQIMADGEHPYLSFAAVEGDLHVNIGGQGEPLEPTEDLYRLMLNSYPGTVLYFDNPIHSVQTNDFILRSRFGEAVLTQSYLESAANLTGEKVFFAYGLEDATTGGSMKTVAPTNSFANFGVNGGTWIFGENTTNTIAGTFSVNGGTLLATNAVIRQTAQLIGSDPMCWFKGGVTTFSGGEVTVGGMTIGAAPGMPQDGAVVVDGVVRVVQMDYVTGSGKTEKTFGTPVIRDRAASAALTLTENADMTVRNFRFQRRNLFQNGGRLRLEAGTGIIDMGMSGKTRYWLNGGRVETPCFQQFSKVITNNAHVIINGGTLVATKSGFVFFQNFDGSLKNGACVVGNKGGTIETAYSVSITNELYRGTYLDAAEGDTWNYAAADYLTAPALKKTGKGTLTVKSNNATENSYICATDVAAGTLKLSGATASLPTSGVVRVTGGTLDLGGNVQTLKALCGTAGTVMNGSVTVTEGVYPGGAGAVGAFTNAVALAGALYVDVAADGTSDTLYTTTELDLSAIDLVVVTPATVPELKRRPKMIVGPCSGAFRSVSLPAGWTVAYRDGFVKVGPDIGLSVIVR